MLKAIVTASVLAFPQIAFAGNQEALESAFWDHAATSGSLETIELFIQSFPESVFIEDAEVLAAKLREDARRRDFESALTGIVGSVTFTSPLEYGDVSIVGSSIAEIIKGSPSYPPVEGLPEEAWKDATCASCHQWTRDDLCAQAQTYAARSPSKYQSKRHPFGGPFKINLSIWAQGGCK